MQTMSQILGVSLEVYKERRQLTPEADGYLGQLWSGSAVILAIIDPDARPTMSLFRDGSDHYIKQKDWLNNPATESQQKCHELYLASRKFADGTKVYGIKMPLRVDEERSINTVHYPENMLMLVQYDRKDGALTGDAVIWKIALVSQNGEFFLTRQEAYDVRAYENDKSRLCWPRFGGHKQLERLLVENAPADLPRFPFDLFKPELKAEANGLKRNEGIVDRWYDARNIGCIITSQGAARVHWREAPARPRRRFLVAGEKVQFADLQTPPQNPETKWRKTRKARFRLQAFDVKVA